MLPTKGAVPMKVKIHYATVGGSGGMLILTEDASALPRLPEVGEKITTDLKGSGSKRTYEVETIDWVIEDTALAGIPVYEVTMNIRCQAVSTKVPTQQ